ncbi:DUF6807 domain-containing protein [Pedobacter frigoris]|uniref:Methane oxygenase PmoA n=1 Tax=Pedobacter frigoris TaxID=2571272 RepID=A0A4U1CQB1_9SPHI|nr:PmoA family protein [Pedobacter frigoris]TKC09516.1 hypothetical protein FA047_05330 [Pedobacter frigoris]
MKNKLMLTVCCLVSLHVHAQSEDVSFVSNSKKERVEVMIGGKHFTNFIYPKDLEKPVLYPIISAGGQLVTRGFPLEKRDGERIDHPHHMGLWLNYESVNGLDFWNNSYNIPVDRKSKYGWIRNVRIERTESGKNKGILSYSANWENQAAKVLLREQTTFVFSGTSDSRTIDRTTILTAAEDSVFFKDVKDGMLGIRLTKELEFASDKVEEFTDSQGNVTKVSASGNGANGNYLTSKGITGAGAWGTRGNWCMLYANKEGKPLAVSIIDHPKNPGYPTYWHARDYGLFAANPLGQQVFSNGKETLNLKLKPGQSITFKYRIIINSGIILTADALDQQAKDFSKK